MDLLDLSDDVLCQLASTMEVDSMINNQEDHEKQHLSQKFSQLSASEDHHHHQPSNDAMMTTTTTTNKRSPLVAAAAASTTLLKKRKLDEVTVKQLKDKIPTYLSVHQPEFQHMVQSILSTTANSFHLEDVQEIALLIRQMAMIDLDISLWTSYLQSGTGQLENDRRSTTTTTPHPAISVWPSEIKSLIIMEEEAEKKKESDMMTTIHVHQIDHDACLNYVYQTLHEFINRKIQYQTQLDEKKHHLNTFFTLEIEEAIVQFIEQQEMIFLRIEMESKIAIVQYDYQDRCIEFDYHQLKPNPYQVNSSK
jgi:hypothetical protein